MLHSGELKHSNNIYFEMNTWDRGDLRAPIGALYTTPQDTQNLQIFQFSVDYTITKRLHSFGKTRHELIAALVQP